MEIISKNWKSLKKSIKEFHTKKPHIEFFTALLTIPVLLTVIILNLNNLKADDEKETPKNQTIVITQSAPEKEEVVVTSEACEPGIGDISIVNPEEEDEVTGNPVSVDIVYEPEGFCEVVWSYRINNGSWSSYDDRSIALYNLPNGDIKFDLRVKSVVNTSQKTLTRNFNYSGGSVSLTPTVTPNLTP